MTFYLTLSLLLVILALLLVVLRVLDWHEEQRAHGAYRMSRRQRRAIDKNIQMANPQIGWRGRL